MRDDARWVRVQMWKPLREVFQAADELFAEAARLRGAAEAGPAAGPLPVASRRSGPPPPIPVAPAAYLRRRSELCEAITARLDPVLTDALGPWQHHLCQTAIVSFIDERERVALGSLADAWRLPLVQSQLLQIDDGGDRCFVQLQDLLARVDVHELVFEVHLLCLRAGFVGRYRDRRHELDKIIGWLVERLRSYRPRHALPVVPDAPPVPRRRIGFLGFPVRYYVTVAVVVAGLFVVLRAVSAREVDQSDLATYCHYHESGAGP